MRLICPTSPTNPPGEEMKKSHNFEGLPLKIFTALPNQPKKGAYRDFRKIHDLEKNTLIWIVLLQ